MLAYFNTPYCLRASIEERPLLEKLTSAVCNPLLMTHGVNYFSAL